MKHHANTWPGGNRKALDQTEHEQWNAGHYPGTRQMCIICDQPTGRCEEDMIFNAAGVGPVCESCAHRLPESGNETLK